MRILVYGAGVLGCELAHVLMQNKKNVVTLLARGEWKEMIDQKGLVIRHWVQRKTTTERIKTVDTLAPDDYYDLVFVVMQAGQLPDVLPVLPQAVVAAARIPASTNAITRCFILISSIQISQSYSFFHVQVFGISFVFRFSMILSYSIFT